jgi:hypothetical protein
MFLTQGPVPFIKGDLYLYLPGYLYKMPATYVSFVRTRQGYKRNRTSHSSVWCSRFIFRGHRNWPDSGLTWFSYFPPGMAVLWLRRLVAGLPLRRPGFDPGSVHVGFVVDKVALGQVFLRVVGFPLSISFHRCSITCKTW